MGLGSQSVVVLLLRRIHFSLQPTCSYFVEAFDHYKMFCGMHADSTIVFFFKF